MKNKFNIFDLFFRIKRKKEKVKDKEKKEKEILITNNQTEEQEEYIYPTITPIPFFGEEHKKENKNELKNEQKKNKEEYVYTEINPILNIEKQKKDKIQSPLPNKNKIEIKNSYATPIFYSDEKQITKEEQKDTVEVERSNTNVDSLNAIDNTLEIKMAILNRVENLIKEEYYELNKINEELKVIEKEDKDELTKKEIENLIEKLKEIIKRFEKIKKEFYSNHYDKIPNGTINDSYINELIEDYKISLKNNDLETLPSIQIKEIEEYIDIIQAITIIENKSTEVKDNLEDKKDELNIADKEMDEYLESFDKIEKINTYIDSFSKEQAQIINDIRKKVDEKDKITKTVEYKTELAINYSKLLASTLLMATTAVIPQTKTGNLLKLGLMIAAVSSMSKAVRMSTKESKVTTKITSIDYTDSIKSGLSNINEMDKMVSQSLKDIKSMKNEFQKTFTSYKNIIPEYSNILAKLDSVEKELVLKQQLAKEYENKLNNTLQKNNIKIKRLDEEYFN